MEYLEKVTVNKYLSKTFLLTNIFSLDILIDTRSDSKILQETLSNIEATKFTIIMSFLHLNVI